MIAMMVRSIALYSCMSLIFIDNCFGSNHNVSECDKYVYILNDDAKREIILNWADDEIFSRRFRRENFDEFVGFVGPGRNGADLLIDNLNIKIPEIIKNYSIRSVGPDRYYPNVIFLALRRFQGIVVVRGGIDESLKGTGISIDGLKELHGRLAMICSPD